MTNQPTMNERLAALQGQIDLMYRRHEELINRIGSLEIVVDDLMMVDGEEPPVSGNFLDGTPMQ